MGWIQPFNVFDSSTCNLHRSAAILYVMKSENSCFKQQACGFGLVCCPFPKFGCRRLCTEFLHWVSTERFLCIYFFWYFCKFSNFCPLRTLFAGERWRRWWCGVTMMDWIWNVEWEHHIMIVYDDDSKSCICNALSSPDDAGLQVYFFGFGSSAFIRCARHSTFCHYGVFTISFLCNWSEEFQTTV